MKFVFVLFALVACASAFFRSKLAFEVRSISGKCITKVNLSAADQAKISACNFESTPGIGQYVSCLYNDLGLMDDKVPNLDRLVSQFNTNEPASYASDEFEEWMKVTQIKGAEFAAWAAAYHKRLVSCGAAVDYAKNFCPKAPKDN